MISNASPGRRRPSRRGLLLGGGGLACFSMAGPVAWPAAAQAPQGGHALEDFFKRPAVRHVALSPDGERIAILRETTQGGVRRAMLDIVDASDPAKPPLRHPLGVVDCEAMQWAKDSRILVRVAMKTTTGRDNRSARSLISVEGQEITSRRIISIDPASGGAVVLFDNDRQRMRQTRNLGVVIDLLHDDAEHVLMVAPSSIGLLGLHRVNVITGAADQIETGGNNTYNWATANGVAVLRYDVNLTGSAISIHARAPGEREWRFVRRVRVDEAPDFHWISETDRPGTVLVSAREEGEDVKSVRELDLRTLTLGAPMTARTGADVAGSVLDRRDRYLGAAYWKDRLEYDFATPELAPHHRAMNRFFEDECNVAFTDMDQARNRILAYVSGPREPGAWYLYDRAARRFVNLAPRTELATERLGRTEAITVTTRDGAEIPAYLTAPPGAAPGPLVVMPHGGPEVRDVMDWNRQIQVLAARGWWVLQPNFRGSGGYGQGFAGEGWKRWGERMQEDVEDAVAQVIAARGLDRDRVAIMGASYGGYAALMGAVRRPDLYKAAISICGVSDLPDMLGWEKRSDDTPGEEIYGFWVKRIGDPAADRAMLEAASPRRRADEVVCPVLLVHGADDPVVPVFQSRQMHSALRGAGKSVDYVEVADAGHGDWEDDKEQELMTRYVALLTRAFA